MDGLWFGCWINVEFKRQTLHEGECLTFTGVECAGSVSVEDPILDSGSDELRMQGMVEVGSDGGLVRTGQEQLHFSLSAFTVAEPNQLTWVAEGLTQCVGSSWG